MREILFRGKRTDNIEWVYGAYFPESDPYPTAIFHGKHNGIGSYVITKTVGQYTGLTDKKGNKIFEGDIVKIGSFMPGADDWVCAIEWDYALFEEYKYVWNTKCEVIGNIHDNPELLEVSDNG